MTSPAMLAVPIPPALCPPATEAAEASEGALALTPLHRFALATEATVETPRAA